MEKREDQAPAVAEPEEVEVEAKTLLELVLMDPQPTPAPADVRIDGVVVGVLAGFGAQGEPLVAFRGCPGGEALPARSTVALAAAATGREVALMFEGGDARRPLVIGLIQEIAPPHVEVEPPAPAEPQATADGKQVVFEAEDELVLRCGKASITLTRAGKIVIRGAYVVTRASGVNRIQGGSVQIN